MFSGNDSLFQYYQVLIATQNIHDEYKTKLMMLSGHELLTAFVGGGR